MTDDVDEILRRHRRPEGTPQPRKGVRWKLSSDSRRDQAIRRQPPVLGTVRRIVGKIR